MTFLEKIKSKFAPNVNGAPKLKRGKEKSLKQSLSQKIVFWIVSVFFCILALTYLYVLVWCFVSGVRTHDAIVAKPMGYTEFGHFANLIYVFKEFKIEDVGFFMMFVNSLYFSMLGPLITNMFTCMLAYVTNKYKFPGSKIFYFATIVMITLPIYGSGGSAWQLYNWLGIVNNYSYIITFFCGINMNYLIYYATFESLSWSYAEAALIDGANEFQVFFKAMFPLVLNIFGSLFIVAWVGAWNDYSSALIYLNKLPTLASGIYNFGFNQMYAGRFDILYAAYFITSIPPLIMFTVFNKALTSNVSLGGLKE